MQYSIVNYKNVLTNNPLFRIDAEFFKSEYFDAEIKLQKHTVKHLGDISKSIVNFGAYALCNYIDFLSAGVPYLNVGDILENWIDYDGAKKIDEHLSRTILTKSLVREKQVLLTIAGTIGNAAVAYKFPAFTNSNQAIANIELYSDISPFYLSTYLNSKYGKLQTRRLTISSVQPNLLLVQVKNIKVPILSYSFQNLIEEIYKKSHHSRMSAQNMYFHAEQVLLTELNLLHWKPSHRLTFIKNYSEADKAERIDAEYFQPKYDEIAKAIESYSGGWDTLGNIASLKKCVEVGSEAYINEGDIPFIRVSNLSPFELTEEKYISSELYAELSHHQPQLGEILFSKDATPGIAYHLKEKPKKMIPSGGILRLKLKTKQVNEDYLTLVLNSIIVKEQINRDAGGSVILHWRPEQVRETLIPILPEDKQSQIQQKVTESFSPRKQSKHLLECAKRAVEIAIEQNEDAAIKWLQEQTKEAWHGAGADTEIDI